MITACVSKKIVIKITFRTFFLPFDDLVVPEAVFPEAEATAAKDSGSKPGTAKQCTLQNSSVPLDLAERHSFSGLI